MKIKILPLAAAALLLLSLAGCGAGQDSSISSSGRPSQHSVSRQLRRAREKNSDVVGWLTVDGCEIDNPVFQGEDNEEYLRVDEEGNSDVWGCYFMDCENTAGAGGLQDSVTIIYGHSLEDEADSEKFSKLKRYKDAQFARRHPEISLELMSGQTQWQIFSACDVPVSLDYTDPNPSQKDLEFTLDFLTRYSYVDFGTSVGRQDRILILSTCTSDESIRYVIAARLKQ